jgi:protein CpxP
VKTRTLFLPALALLVGLSGASLAPSGALAQANAPAYPPAAAPATAPGAPAQPALHQHRQFSASRHIEGKLAYMKAELQITPAQQAQWDKVAQVMRDNAKETDATFAQLRSQDGTKQPQNAVQRLEAHGRFSALRAKQSDRLLAAFRPLYDGLSDQQKQTADHLMSGHHHHGHHGGI